MATPERRAKCSGVRAGMGHIKAIEGKQFSQKSHGYSEFG
ncbi:MAG: hypothetical protein ACI8Y6_002541, partial [Brevundimonas sp.]